MIESWIFLQLSLEYTGPNLGNSLFILNLN